MNENNSIALYRLGSCYYKEQNPEAAEEYFIKAIEADETNTSAIADLGIIYYEQKKYEDAIKTFCKAINISAEKAYLYFYIANCYYKMGKMKKSIDYYEKTIEYYPRHIEAYINYSLCLLSMDNIREALRKIRNAYQLNRESEKILLIYAFIDLKSGILSDAAEKTDMLLAKNPDNKEAKFIKVHTFINMKKPQEALNLLDTFKEEDKKTGIYTYLSYLAYKILVEDSPSHYNESMLNEYISKLKDMNIDVNNTSSLNSYIMNAININKG